MKSCAPEGQLVYPGNKVITSHELENVGIVITTTEHFRGHLRHKDSVIVKQVMMTSVKL